MHFPKETLLYDIKTAVCVNPDQGGSKEISTSTHSSCSLHWFRGEAALHDPHVLRVARVPSSPQIFYLTTIIKIHSRTKNMQKNARPVPQISWAEASGWCDAPKGAQTSYSQALSTSVFSYRGHFILSNPSCFGIYFVGGGAVWSRLYYVGKSLEIIFERILCMFLFLLGLSVLFLKFLCHFS